MHSLTRLFLIKRSLSDYLLSLIQWVAVEGQDLAPAHPRRQSFHQATPTLRVERHF